MKSTFAVSIIAVSAATLLLVGCSTTTKATPCQRVEVWLQDQLSRELAQVSPHLRDVAMKLHRNAAHYMRERCEQDRWAANAITCVVASTTSQELGTCRSLLTSVQRRELALEGQGILGELAVELHSLKQ